MKIAAQARLRERIADQNVDENRRNEFHDDLVQVDPYAGDPPSRRKDGEIARMLDLLDSLPTGKGSV